MIKLKRRKDKYNPYTLIEDNQLAFKDSHGEQQLLKISNELYNVFNEFELQDKRIMNEYDRHVEHFEQSDEMLYKKLKNINQSLEETVIRQIEIENLYYEIEKLPEIQKRRLKMYYFENLTLKEIAKIENCSFQSISYSIECAIKNLAKKMKK